MIQDINNFKPGMRVVDMNPTWEDYKKHGIVISVEKGGLLINWKVYGGSYKQDRVEDLKILGLKNKRPKSKMTHRNKLILPNNIRRKRKNNINRKIMWGKNLPHNLEMMSWRFYSTKIRQVRNNLRKWKMETLYKDSNKNLIKSMVQKNL